MGRITLEQAAAWCGGKIDPRYAQVTFLGANNDTRILKPGQLFLALQGVRDGHAFIPAALTKGAAAVLCTHCDGDYPAIVVPDVRLALGAIARGERQRLGMKVVGVTGSVGKSTTKEMIAAVLGSTYRVSKSPANHNNDIGMPMAILDIPEDTEVAVLEMGMNHFGEISYLTHIARPDAAVIINIGTMHIEHLGSREGILKAKLEILEGLTPGGSVILNGDDPLLFGTGLDAVYFGTENSRAAVRGRDIRETADGIFFRVESGSTSFPVELALEGLHHVSDALAAAAVGLAFAVAPEKIGESLASFQNMAGRQEIFTARDCTIIRDCYNAGPESMAAALAVLGKKTGRKIAVLGDMLELGETAPAAHYRVGQLAARNADVLLSYGPNSGHMASGAAESGMAEARSFLDRDALTDALIRLARPGDTLLFKGSHGMHMELALERFLKEER